MRRISSARRWGGRDSRRRLRRVLCFWPVRIVASSRARVCILMVALWSMAERQRRVCLDESWSKFRVLARLQTERMEKAVRMCTRAMCTYFYVYSRMLLGHHIRGCHGLMTEAIFSSHMRWHETQRSRSVIPLNRIVKESISTSLDLLAQLFQRFHEFTVGTFRPRRAYRRFMSRHFRPSPSLTFHLA